VKPLTIFFAGKNSFSEVAAKAGRETNAPSGLSLLFPFYGK
jgi:hypothetical protein